MCSGNGYCPVSTCICNSNSSGVWSGSNCETYLILPSFSIPSIQNAIEGILFVSPAPILNFAPTNSVVVWILISTTVNYAYQSSLSIDNTTGVITWLNPVASETTYTIQLAAQSNVGQVIKSFQLKVDPAYSATASVSSNTLIINTYPASPLIINYNASWSVNNSAAANVYVNIWIQLNGYTSTYPVVTNSQGAGIFSTLPSIAGVANIYATHPSVQTLPSQPQAVVIVYGINYVPSTIYATVISGQNITITSNLMNLGMLVTNFTTLISSYSYPLEQVNVDLLPNKLYAFSKFTSTITIIAQNVSTTASASTQSVYIQVNSTEGAIAVISLQITVLPPQVQLQALPSSLTSTAIINQQSLLSFTLTNNGGIPATNLRVSLPPVSWMSVAAPFGGVLSSLGIGEFVVFTLAFTVDSSVGLGRFTGSMIVNCDQSSLTIGLDITVSYGGVGSLRVDIQDEYTFYAPGYPQVAGATVQLINPLQNNLIVATATTNSSGFVEFINIPTGSYQVQASAVNHSSSQNVTVVYPSTESQVALFLYRTAVSYSFTVVPVPFQDTYQIVVTTTFETHVPLPVITIDPPYVNMNSLA